MLVSNFYWEFWSQNQQSNISWVMWNKREYRNLVEVKSTPQNRKQVSNENSPEWAVWWAIRDCYCGCHFVTFDVFPQSWHPRHLVKFWRTYLVFQLKRKLRASQVVKPHAYDTATWNLNTPRGVRTKKWKAQLFFVVHFLSFTKVSELGNLRALRKYPTTLVRRKHHPIANLFLANCQ